MEFEVVDNGGASPMPPMSPGFSTSDGGLFSASVPPRRMDDSSEDEEEEEAAGPSRGSDRYSRTETEEDTTSGISEGEEESVEPEPETPRAGPGRNGVGLPVVEARDPGPPVAPILEPIPVAVPENIAIMIMVDGYHPTERGWGRFEDGRSYGPRLGRLPGVPPSAVREAERSVHWRRITSLTYTRSHGLDWVNLLQRQRSYITLTPISAPEWDIALEQGLSDLCCAHATSARFEIVASVRNITRYPRVAGFFRVSANCNIVWVREKEQYNWFCDQLTFVILTTERSRYPMHTTRRLVAMAPFLCHGNRYKVLMLDASRVRMIDVGLGALQVLEMLSDNCSVPQIMKQLTDMDDQHYEESFWLWISAELALNRTIRREGDWPIS